jgi:hypothetical protein
MSLIITFMFEPAKLQMNCASASGTSARRKSTATGGVFTAPLATVRSQGQPLYDDAPERGLHEVSIALRGWSPWQASDVAAPADENTAREHRRLVREGTTTALYISIVLLAELVALGDEHGWELAALIWGTTIGLVVAHAFAFRIATHGLTGGRLAPEDLAEVRAELVGATAIGVIASVPILLFRSSTEM